MDLTQILLHTYSPNAAERNGATETIERLGPTEGFAVSLLQAVTLASVDPSVRLAAAVTFKNTVVKFWSVSRAQHLCESDKRLIKDNIVEVIAASPNRLRASLIDALKEIIKRDFPDNWDGVVPKVLSFIKSEDILRVTGGLLVARFLFKKYAYKSDISGAREPLYELTEVILPAVGPMFERVVAMDAPEAGALCVLIAKILFCCVQSGIPRYFYNVEVADPWIRMLLTLMAKDMPEDEPDEWSSRATYVWWKAKKWVLHVFTRLHARNANVEKAAQKWPHTVPFAREFSTNYSVAILNACLHVTSGAHRHRGIPGQIMSLILSFFNSAIRYSVTYKAFIPHMEPFMSQVMFPIFCFNTKDEELWLEDPAELIRRDSDMMENYYDPRLASVTLLLDLLHHRGRESLRIMMSHVVRVLSAYASTPDPSKRDYHSKSGAMYILGHMCVKLKQLPEYKDGLSDLMTVHILPELANPVGFIRSRACWVFGQFFDVEYGTPDPFLHGLQTILHLLSDAELPVRMRAAIALRFLVRNSLAKEPLKHCLPQVLESLFGMMNEIDVEDLVQTLQIFILVFNEDIVPYAEALCGKLAENFLRMVSQDDGDDDITATAAYEVLSALQILLSSIAKDTSLLSRIETVMMPLMVKLFEPDCYEYFEDALKILTELVYFAPAISENMWSLFPLMYRAFDTYAFDWVDHMLMPIENYIRKDTANFLRGPHEMVFAMFKRLVGDPIVSDYEAGEGVTLIELVLHHCFPHITGGVPEIMSICITRYFHENTRKFALRVTLMGIIFNVMFFDPRIAVDTLNGLNCLPQTFAALYELVMQKPYTRIRDLKLAILGLSSLLRLPVGSMPPALQGELLTIVRMILTLQYKLAEARTKDAEEQKELESKPPARGPPPGVDDDSVLENPVHQDKDVGGDTLAELSERARAFVAAYEEEEEDDEDDMFDDDDQLEGTPMADVNEVCFFIATLEEFMAREGDVGGNLLGGLSHQEQTYLSSLQEFARANTG